MANTFSQLYVQVVFAVKNRESLIHKNNREELQKYISGIIENRNAKLLAIYCMPNDKEVTLGSKPSVLLSDLVRDIKAGSSKFINEKRWIKGKFNWQEGFGAFSYSHSQIGNVIRYINKQETHHQKKSFKVEYLDFLQKFEIDYDEKYLFEWIEDG